MLKLSFLKRKSRLPKLKVQKKAIQMKPYTRILTMDHTEHLKIRVTSSHFINPKEIHFTIEDCGINKLITIRDSDKEALGVINHYEFLATEIYWFYLWDRDIHPSNLTFFVSYETRTHIEEMRVTMEFNEKDERFERATFKTESRTLKETLKTANG